MVASAMRVAGWEDFAGLCAGFSTRVGGVSTAYAAGAGELNLGFTVEDERERVLENRRRLLATVGGKAWPGNDIKTARQVHGTRIVQVGAGFVPGSVEADGLITNEAGVMLGVLAADCGPVLVADVRRRAAGAFHAGWRGTVARVVEAGVARMVAELGARPEDMVAAVGPSIGACCYEVGEELRERFAGEFGYGAELFSRGMYLDLWEANRRQLAEAGVRRVTVVGECTACARFESGGRKYFSHRAEKGVAGRGMGVVGFGDGV